MTTATMKMTMTLIKALRWQWVRPDEAGTPQPLIITTTLVTMRMIFANGDHVDLPEALITRET